MSRDPLPPVPRVRMAAILLVALAIGLVACGDDPPDPVPQGAHDGVAADERGAAAAHAAEGGPDAAWLAAPVARRIVLVGDLRGKHKPCGCTAPQVGGVGRLAALMDRLRVNARQGIGALALGSSLGGTFEDQEESKAEFLRGVLEVLGFSGVLLGEHDLHADAMAQAYGDPNAGGLHRPVPPLNAILPRHAAAHGVPPILDADVAGQKVRVMGVLSATRGEMMKREGLVEHVMAPTAPFSGRMAPRPDVLWIVASHLEDHEQVAALARALKPLGPAVVVSLRGLAGEESVAPRPLVAGMEPLVVRIEDKGKGVGVLDLSTAADGTPTIAFRHVRLVPSLEEGESPSRDDVQELLEIYKDTVAERGYLADHPRHPDPGVATYVGSAACATCHPGMFADWHETPHAHAVPTLVQVRYAQDPECIRCHVVGWQRTAQDRWLLWESGYRTAETSPHLGGVGCETCHGPGSQHVRDPDAHPLFHPEGEGKDAAWRRRCVSCHDTDNSHGFHEDFAGYLRRVDHRRVPSDRRTRRDWQDAR